MTIMERDTLEHARENARGWLESIQEMVARLEHAQEYPGFDCADGDQCELYKADKNLIGWQDYHDADAAREAIEESVLSVEVRSGWTTPGSDFEAVEYMILLTTGGPALRIIGQLGLYGEPETATLEMQDWGTPWTEYAEMPDGTDKAVERWHTLRSTLLTFARCFYFGE